MSLKAFSIAKDLALTSEQEHKVITGLADYYRNRAQDERRLAEGEVSPLLRDVSETLALQYEALSHGYSRSSANPRSR